MLRTILSTIVWVYFLAGAGLGLVIFGMRALEAAMGAPEFVDLAGSLLMAAAEGILRGLYWLPSLYDQVIVHGVSFGNWLFS